MPCIRHSYGVTVIICPASEVALSLHSPGFIDPALLQIAGENLSVFKGQECSFFACFLVHMLHFQPSSFFLLLQHKKCSTAVPDGDGGDAVSADSGVVPTVFESTVLQQNNQPPAACTKPSKWEKYLSCSNNRSENAVMSTLSPQDGSGRLGPHSTAAVSKATTHLEQVQSALPLGTDFESKKCVASTEQLALKLPGSMQASTSCSGENDALAKEAPSQVLWAAAGDCSAGSRPAPSLARPTPHTTSCERLFCTGDDFNDDF